MKCVYGLVLLFFVLPCMANNSVIVNPIMGWNILSDNVDNAYKVIDASSEFKINHLQLSHDLVMNLCELRDESRRLTVENIVNYAHRRGINEVLLWDHALYDLDYYPNKFKTGPNGELDLDNEEFWSWFRNDYREMLQMASFADGIVLTFIETGARIEKQYSESNLSVNEKFALLINAISDVVCREFGKKLYIRTFAYTVEEYNNIIGCLDMLKCKDIILMMKETPHDFFLTHPNNSYIKNIEYKTIVEFDTGNEFHGQGIVANTWPEYVIGRWKDYSMMPNVIGYVARTDRYKTSTIVGTPNDILLFALMRFTENDKISVSDIYDEYIASRYGVEVLPYLKQAFQNAFDIATSIFYTLGTNTANHSQLNYDPYASSYYRHVSGRWIDPPYVYVGHGVNKKFHYWRDVIEHLAPPRLKTESSPLRYEYPRALNEHWVTPVDKINEEYLHYIKTEKEFGVLLAKQSLDNVRKCQQYMDKNKYSQLESLFYRTLMTAKLHKAVSVSYWGYRLYAKKQGKIGRNVLSEINTSLNQIRIIASEILAYDLIYPKGQWDWMSDAFTALDYYKKITMLGWSDYGNMKFDISPICVE